MGGPPVRSSGVDWYPVAGITPHLQRNDIVTPVVQSRGGVPIRLTAERWTHIVEEHAELAGRREEVLETVTDAERVVEGQGGELLAVRSMEERRAMVVVYREVDQSDGFIITAFLTRRLASIDRRQQLWPPTK